MLWRIETKEEFGMEEKRINRDEMKGKEDETFSTFKKTRSRLVHDSVKCNDRGNRMGC